MLQITKVIARKQAKTTDLSKELMDQSFVTKYLTLGNIEFL
jgi:hypothetical protein